MGFKGELGTLPVRPNCWSFDLQSVASSGYCSAEPSTELEYPPFDFDSVRERLEDLQEDNNVQVTLSAPEPLQYTQTDCTFVVEVSTRNNNVIDRSRNYFESLDAHVVGPSGRRYQVKQRPEMLSSSTTTTSTQMTCSFRPVECGPHKCYVELELLSNPFLEPPPPPLILNISRKYDNSSRPIITSDIEISEECQDKIEQRKPWGLCTNTKTEQVLVTDREKHEIIVLNNEGEIEFRFGSQGQGPGQFFRPSGIAYNSKQDRILVADKDNHRIQIFSSSGEYISSFGRKGNYNGQFFFPWDVAVSKDGEFIAVTDSRNHRVQLFDAHGQFLRKFCIMNKDVPFSKKEKRSSQYKLQEFDYPRGLCFDNTGEHIYITDFNLHSLLKVDIKFNGNYERVLSGEDLKRPQGLTVDEAGNILLCDSRNNSLKVISPDGKVVTDVIQLGPLKIEQPLDVVMMKGGFVALLDLNGRVRVF